MSQINYDAIPAWALESLEAYVETGRPTGDFLRACLTNNLVEACGRADEHSILALRHIVGWIYNKAPGACWHTEDQVDAWIKVGGRRGMGWTP